MDIEIFRPGSKFGEDLIQDLLGYSSPLDRGVNLHERVELINRFIRFLEFIIDDLLILFFIMFHKLILCTLNFFSTHTTFFNNFLTEGIIRSFGIFYHLVHFWLGEGRLILLVVAVSAVSYNVDENIFFELESVFDCNFHDSLQKGRLVGVDVEHGCSDNFGNLGTVVARTTLLGVCCEPDLVIHHNVNNSFWSVVFQILHFSGFINNPLPGNCCISMHNHSQGLVSTQIIIGFHSGPNRPIN